MSSDEIFPCTYSVKSSMSSSDRTRVFWVFHSVITKITKTGLSKYFENFTTRKEKFSNQNSDIFQSSSQNIDCGYSLELS